jgi:Spy/CpxP family protein refolding chaperone
MNKYVLIALALPFTLCAQGPREFGWWDSPIVNTLNLSDGQRKQIRSTISDYRNRLVDLRAGLQKAEGDLQDIFNDDPVDQRKANEAIDRLANSRGELTKVLSQMDLRLRMVLTAQQWQELQSRGRGPRPGVEGRGSGGSGFGKGLRRRSGEAPQPTSSKPVQQ